MPTLTPMAPLAVSQSGLAVPCAGRVWVRGPGPGDGPVRMQRQPQGDWTCRSTPTSSIGNTVGGRVGLDAASEGILDGDCNIMADL